MSRNWIKKRSAIPIVFLVFLLVYLGTAFARDVSPKVRTPLALETFDAVWTQIHEHHFDTNFNGVDWLKVREKYRPKAAAAKTKMALRKVLQEMIDLLQVSHMNIVPGDVAQDIRGNKSSEKADLEAAPEDDSGTIGLSFRFIADKAIVTRVEPGQPAAKAGVKAGWILNKIGKLHPEEFARKLPEKLGEQKRRFLVWRAVSNRLNGLPGSIVNLEFIDADNQPHQLGIKREIAPGEAVQLGNLPTLYANLTSMYFPETNAKIGIIRFNIWMLPTAIAFNKAIDAHRLDDGLIIDLRGNVGGLVGMLIGASGHFFNEPGSLGTMVMRDNKLKLPINPRLVDGSGKRVKPFSGPVAIVVDGTTASASEVFAGGMQDLGRARIFGRTTSGQALPAILEDLPNGDALYHPVADFIPPRGRRFEGRGVVPNEEIPLNRNALLQGRDLDVERAAAWLLKQKDK